MFALTIDFLKCIVEVLWLYELLEKYVDCKNYLWKNNAVKQWFRNLNFYTLPTFVIIYWYLQNRNKRNNVTLASVKIPEVKTFGHFFLYLL